MVCLEPEEELISFIEEENNMQDDSKLDDTEYEENRVYELNNVVSRLISKSK